MNLNFLEILGVIMILFVVSIAVLCLYYLIKDTVDKWKKFYRNKCPFCGAYLHGYRYKRKGAKHNACYCSRCGRALNETENTFDPIKFKDECVELLLSCNDYRKRVLKLGCESCIYFRNQCNAISGEFIPGIFENECKHRSVVLRKEKNDED